jgi:hypothetical protein
MVPPVMPIRTAEQRAIFQLAMALSGFGNGVTFPMTVLIVQEHTVDRLRGRAFTLIISAHNYLHCSRIPIALLLLIRKRTASCRYIK